jgi:hypothetical protein
MIEKKVLRYDFGELKNVDIPLLKKQVRMLSLSQVGPEMDGLIDMLDEMISLAERKKK